MPDNNIIAFPGAARSNTTGRLLIGTRIRDARKALSLTQGDLGEAIGVTRQAISSYELGDKTPDADVFSRLTKELRQPVSFFTALDNPVFGEAGTRFYRKYGSDTVRRNDACAVLGDWFVQTAHYLSEYVNLPMVDVPEFKALAGNYTFEQVNDIADQVRRAWGLGFGPLSNVLALLESKGIVTCRSEMSGEKVEAFSFWNGDRPFVFMATEKDVAVRSRFDLAHELGHLVLHRDVSQAELEDKGRLKIVEREANWFAGAFLLPHSSFSNEIYSPRLDAFLPLKSRWKVSIQAMIYRCHSLGIFDDDQTLNLRKQISFRRWRTSEPMDDPRIIALEQPKILRKAVDLLLSHKVKHADELCSDIRLNPTLIEQFCCLPVGSLTALPAGPFEPTLK